MSKEEDEPPTSSIPSQQCTICSRQVWTGYNSISRGFPGIPEVSPAIQRFEAWDIFIRSPEAIAVFIGLRQKAGHLGKEKKMKNMNIKNLRTTTITLLIATLAVGSGAYAAHIGPSLAHAGVIPLNASFTVTPSSSQVNVTNVNSNGIRAMSLEIYIKTTVQTRIFQVEITEIQCTLNILPSGIVQCTINAAHTRMVIIVQHTIVVTYFFRADELDSQGTWWIQDFNSAGVAQTAILPTIATPGSGQLLFHEYTSTDLEMQAFQAGSIDMVDWDIPQQYLNTWNTCTSAAPIGPNCNGQISTAKYSATDMYQIDMNENGSRVASQLSFRQAMGYLVDRQNIVLNIASGFATPICSQASGGQEGSASCQSLGYPGPYGDFNPTKGLQLLYEDGWRFDSANGFLYGPALPGCSSTIPGQTGNFCVRSIIFMIRADDPLRLGAGQAMANTMVNLPNVFCPKVSGNTNPIPPCPAGVTAITVCPTAPCKLDTTLNVAAKPALAKIFQHAPWNRWDLYTGGWGLDLLAADDLPFLYTSAFAPAPDCGTWQGDFPNNYGGFCSAAFNTAMDAVLAAPTITQADAAAVAGQSVAWGYSASQGKITGLEPTVPMYSHLAYKAAWLKDVANGLCANGSAVGSAGCPSPTYAQRACWQNFIQNEVGTGLSIYDTVLNWFDDNCAGNTKGHVNYQGNPNAVNDWGFINPIEFLNIMQSTFVWDVQAMQFTYDAMLGRNPANPSELRPFLCSDYTVGTYFNTHTAASATYFACHLRSDLLWSDGAPLRALDIAFTMDYVAENQAPLYASNVANLCGPNFTSIPFYSPTNCGNGVQIVNNADGTQTIAFYFDSISAVFPLILSLATPIIPQHVYCNDWTGPVAGKLGPGATPTANCLFPDMAGLPDKAGLSDGSCTDCAAFPGTYPGGAAVPVPSYLSALGYGTTIKNWQTGSGPYQIVNCGGASCGNTILLKRNPYWHDGIRMASPATGDSADPSGAHGGLALQPDLNRDGFINSKDLALARTQLNSGNFTDWKYSGTLRQGIVGNDTIAVPSSVCGTGCPQTTARDGYTGWPETSTDIAVINEFIQQGIVKGLCVAVGSDPCGQGGLSWPPPSGSVTNHNGYLPSGVVGSLSGIWPDSSGTTAGVTDDLVNVNDLVYVFTHQFVTITDSSGNIISGSPYTADVTHQGVIDIHSLVTTLTREFSQPAGVVP